MERLLKKLYSFDSRLGEGCFGCCASHRCRKCAFAVIADAVSVIFNPQPFSEIGRRQS